MSTPANALNITQAGLVKFDGTNAFTGVTTTQHDVLVGAASNGITNISPSTSGFVLTSNGVSADPSFQSVSSSGAITTITGNSGGAESPLAGNFNILGTGSITVAGSANTETVQLTGLTNHAVLVGAGTATITKVGPTSTVGQVLQSAGAAADPAFSTATYPLTTTINQILYSSAANTITGLATANRGVLTTGTTGVPVVTALAADGQLIIGSTAGAPAAATLTAGTGISITNASNSITIAVSGSTVGETITGDTGGALSPTAGNWNIKANPTSGSSVSFSGSGSTLTLNVTDASNNTFIGLQAGNATLTASACTGIGFDALNDLTTGNSNTGVGYQAINNVTTGIQNTAIGIATGGGITTGSYNIFVGDSAGGNLSTSESSNILIGSAGTAADNNTIRIGQQGSGTSQQNKCFIAGIAGVSVANNSVAMINSSTGQLGNLLMGNSTVLATNSSGTIAGRSFSVVNQVFTANGTYTPTTGMLYCQIICVGGGGAGGGAPTTTGVQFSGGGGGGAGEYAQGIFSAATIGASKSVTIGAAGTGNSGATGGNGGNTSVGSTIISANGGSGGVTTAASAAGNTIAGAGGTGGTGGDFRTRGQIGSNNWFSVSAGSGSGGNGANSQYGSGGMASVNTTGGAASGYGAGGGGVLNGGSQGNNTGGAGTAGIVIITEYVIN